MPWLSRTRLRTAGAVLAAALIGGALAAPAARAEPPAGPLTDLVNPFIGSRNDGNTYPGAAVPFGMVQLSPDTGHTTGYGYDDDHIRGFSSVHISGVGCGLGGDLPVLPTTGDITETDYAKYAASYTHDDESARPGYYRVGLKSYGGITAELTATARTGKQRYTFPATDKANVLLNTGQSLHKHGLHPGRGARLAHHPHQPSPAAASARTPSRTPLHTLTRFDRPFTSYGTWDGDKVTAGSRDSTATGRHGAYARFDTRTDRTVEATTAISYVDAPGAARNLRAEGGRSFDRTKAAANAEWERRLGLVRAQGGDTTLRRTFYSSLYRSFLAPNIGSDVDGRYTGWDRGPTAPPRTGGSPTTRTGHCGTPTAPRRNCWRCWRRGSPATWRCRCCGSTRRAAGFPSGATERSRRTS